MSIAAMPVVGLCLNLTKAVEVMALDRRLTDTFQSCDNVRCSTAIAGVIQQVL